MASDSEVARLMLSMSTINEVIIGVIVAIVPLFFLALFLNSLRVKKRKNSQSQGRPPV